ncbi:MAG TPA: hypothetical protein DEG43_12200, partial [Acidimicrobiaceae bacterium]|nr:hypothetical protein [Acidimicrobiaceae bacterium]
LGAAMVVSPSTAAWSFALMTASPEPDCGVAPMGEPGAGDARTEGLEAEPCELGRLFPVVGWAALVGGMLAGRGGLCCFGCSAGGAAGAATGAVVPEVVPSDSEHATELGRARGARSAPDP